MKISSILFATAIVGSVGTAIAFSSRVTIARTASSSIATAFIGRRHSGSDSTKSLTQVRMASSSSTDAVVTFTKNEISTKKVVIFSKSYCPYCTATKELFKQLPVSDVTIYELDNRSDGTDIQNVLLDITGQRTVPNVFINGQHIGGNDKTQAANANGTLEKLLKDAGVWKA